MKKINTYLDDQGNKIITENITIGQKLSLKLISEAKSRLLGIIDIKNKRFIIKRDRKKHLFRNANAYGFNHHILSNTKKFNKIMLSDNFDTWEIPVSYILEKGFFLNFKQQGFERQIFISLADLNPFTIKTF